MSSILDDYATYNLVIQATYQYDLPVFWVEETSENFGHQKDANIDPQFLRTTEESGS